jgi:zinc and cadmium transporter
LFAAQGVARGDIDFGLSEITNGDTPMDTNWIYALASVAAISGMSLLGLFALSLSNTNLQRFTKPMVSVAVGVMLGNAILHMVPEAYEHLEGSGNTVSLLIIAGIFMFFIVERALHCRHECSKPHHPHAIGLMSVSADMLENFIDGIIIGAAYLVNFETGVAATIAVLVHEIPTELSDFSVLVHSGYDRKRALLFNLASSVTAFIGVILALTIGGEAEHFSAYVLPVAAGCFIYLAAGGLIPRFLQSTNLKGSFIHIALMSVGVAAMLALTFLE